MADRTSAEIFGNMFQMLAEDPSDANKTMARRLMGTTRQYDFNHYQMDADEALTTLGVDDLRDDANIED